MGIKKIDIYTEVIKIPEAPRNDMNVKCEVCKVGKNERGLWHFGGGVFFCSPCKDDRVESKND